MGSESFGALLVDEFVIAEDVGAWGRGGQLDQWGLYDVWDPMGGSKLRSETCSLSLNSNCGGLRLADLICAEI